MINFIKDSGYDVVLIPHVVGEEKSEDNDYYVSLELSKKHNLPEPIFFRSPIQVKSYISKCHFFIGSRMHATVGAVSCGIPTLPLAYSRKFKGVFNTIGYYYTFDLKENTNEEIIMQIEKMLSNLPEVQENVNKALNLVNKKTKVYKDDIKRILNSL